MVCHEGSYEKEETEPNCTRDEGRPHGAAMQVEASNRRKRLWTKAMVVSVTEKAERRLCQVSVMETNTSESLIKCRKHREAIKTR